MNPKKTIITLIIFGLLALATQPLGWFIYDYFSLWGPFTNTEFQNILHACSIITVALGVAVIWIQKDNTPKEQEKKLSFKAPERKTLEEIQEMQVEPNQQKIIPKVSEVSPTPKPGEKPEVKSDRPTSPQKTQKGHPQWLKNAFLKQETEQILNNPEELQKNLKNLILYTALTDIQNKIENGEIPFSIDLSVDEGTLEKQKISLKLVKNQQTEKPQPNEPQTQTDTTEPSELPETSPEDQTAGAKLN